MIRSPLRPSRPHAASRLWDFQVNTVAASRLLTMPARCALLRRRGLRLETDAVAPGCHFQTAAFALGPGGYVNRGVFVENSAPVTVGAHSGLGIGSMLVTVTHALGPHEARMGPWTAEPIVIGDGCWVGARATILGGVTIGDGVVVAAGAVVTSDCEADGLYAGVPARRVRELPRGAPPPPPR